jgi:hypothetical protein
MIKIIRHLKYAFVTKTKNIFTNFTTSNHNKCLKLHHSYCLYTVLQLFNFPKITSLLPEPNASPLVYENTPSFITLPITVKLQDIENQTNLLLNGLIQDNNIDDDIEIKVWKLAPSPSYTPMKIGDRIKITLPQSFSKV